MLKNKVMLGSRERDDTHHDEVLHGCAPTTCCGWNVNPQPARRAIQIPARRGVVEMRDLARSQSLVVDPHVRNPAVRIPIRRASAATEDDVQ